MVFLAEAPERTEHLAGVTGFGNRGEKTDFQAPILFQRIIGHEGPRTEPPDHQVTVEQFVHRRGRRGRRKMELLRQLPVARQPFSGRKLAGTDPGGKPVRQLLILCSSGCCGFKRCHHESSFREYGFQSKFFSVIIILYFQYGVNSMYAIS